MFTQPCFIRKNTPELRKKLEEIVLGGDLYGDTNIMGSIRVATFCKKKK